MWLLFVLSLHHSSMAGFLLVALMMAAVDSFCLLALGGLPHREEMSMIEDTLPNVYDLDQTYHDGASRNALHARPR